MRNIIGPQKVRSQAIEVKVRQPISRFLGLYLLRQAQKMRKIFWKSKSVMSISVTILDELKRDHPNCKQWHRDTVILNPDASSRGEVAKSCQGSVSVQAYLSVALMVRRFSILVGLVVAESVSQLTKATAETKLGRT